MNPYTEAKTGEPKLFAQEALGLITKLNALHLLTETIAHACKHGLPQESLVNFNLDTTMHQLTQQVASLSETLQYEKGYLANAVKVFTSTCTESKSNSTLVTGTALRLEARLTHQLAAMCDLLYSKSQMIVQTWPQLASALVTSSTLPHHLNTWLPTNTSKWIQDLQDFNMDTKFCATELLDSIQKIVLAWGSNELLPPKAPPQSLEHQLQALQSLANTPTQTSAQDSSTPQQHQTVNN